MHIPDSLDRLIDDLDVPGVHALVLMGSHARGDAGPYSDLDLVRFVDGERQGHAADKTHLLDGRLIVVSTVTTTQVEAWFSAPDEAVRTILGVRGARPLRDRAGYFAAIQARAVSFIWDAAMQERANRWAGAQMVGWIEEVHKGLEGLRRDDVGRLLNARFGLTWGLGRVMLVRRGVLLSGDNDFYEALVQEMGPDSQWVRLWRTAFAIVSDADQAPSLHQQVIAGLRLYTLTADLLRPVLLPEDEVLISQTSALVRGVLGAQ